MENTKTYKRDFRNYLINRSLQLRMIIINLIYLLIAVIVTVVIVLYPLLRDVLFSGNLDMQHQASQTFLTLIKWLIPIIIILCLFFIVHMIWMTHHFCGPLINFTHTFDRLSRGDLSHKVYTRKGDYLKNESERINLMIDGISGIIIRYFSHHRELMDTLQKLNEQVREADSKEKIELSLQTIKKDMDYISETLASFKVDNNKK